jgi:hypothetical protein
MALNHIKAREISCERGIVMNLWKLRKPIVSMLLAVMLVACTFTTGFAAGEETLPVGTWYDIGSFSFTNVNFSPWKTVEGRYLTMRVDFHKPTWDAGLGEVKLTMDIRDAYTGQSIYGPFVVGTTSGTTVVSCVYYNIDLGYAGRVIQFWFDASSVGTSNGNYRSLTIDIFRVYVSSYPI